MADVDEDVGALQAAELIGRPYGELVATIDARLALPEPAEGVEADRGVREVLAELGELGDAELLVHALQRLAEQGRLGLFLAELPTLLPRLPDTGLNRVLRGLEPTLPGFASAGAVEAVTALLEGLPGERLAGRALLAGWLTRVAPEAGRSYLEQVGARVRAAAGPDELAERDLALLPGRLLEELADRPGWGLRLGAFRDRALELLRQAPRSLSQANAEEILARRVYSDPGHFLFELLQNAADAGARQVRVIIEPERILFGHDGVPFDLRDVVGVLSIGQSSKRKEQIGFFGVGFKSVHGVCERPQVHSGLFSFEIADVSVPRLLADRPAEAQAGETLLVLPLRDPQDPSRNADAVARFAAAIPPETLLTLPTLTRLVRVRDGITAELRREGEKPVGPPETGGRTVDLVLPQQAETRRYRVATRLVRFTGSRESRRAAESSLLVAVRLDEQERPCPVVAGPTLFAHLPTREAAGLRFLVHAHFDLPVDRERLAADSPFNAWLLAEAGQLLADLLIGWVLGPDRTPRGPDQTRRPGQSAPQPELVSRLLELIPIPREVGEGPGRGLLTRLRTALAGVPWLPGSAGQPLSPAGALLLTPPSLARALAGLPLDTQGRQALAPLPPRAEAGAEALGVERRGPQDLPGLLRQQLAGARSGEAAPAWLTRLLEAEEAAEVRGPCSVLAVLLELLARRPDAASTLGELPLLLDEAGRLRRGSELVRASAELRAVYRGTRLCLAPELADQARGGIPELLGRLGVSDWQAGDLLRDLADPIRVRAIVEPDRGVRLWQYLGRQRSDVLRQAGALPLVMDRQGQRWPLVAAVPGGDRIWLPAAGALGAWAAEGGTRNKERAASDEQSGFEAPPSADHRPPATGAAPGEPGSARAGGGLSHPGSATPAPASRHSSFTTRKCSTAVAGQASRVMTRCQERGGAARCGGADLQEGAASARHGPDNLSEPGRRESGAGVQAGRSLPTWSGGVVQIRRSGSARPGPLLTDGQQGDGQPRRGGAGWPWPEVHPELVAAVGPLLEAAGGRRWSWPELLDALGAGRLVLTGEQALALHQVLHEQREELGTGLLRRLGGLQLFPDATGRLRPLAGPDRGLLPADPEAPVLLSWLPWLHARLHGLGHLPLLGVRPVGADALARGLLGEGEARIDVADPTRREALFTYLAHRAEELPRSVTLRLAEAACWPAEDGTLHPLARLRRRPQEPRLAALHAAWGAWPIVDEASGGYRLAVALGLAADLGEADLAGLLRDLVRGPLPPADATFRPLLYELLGQAAGQLPARDLAALLPLPLFPDEQGRLLRLGRAGAPNEVIRWPRPELRTAYATLGCSLLPADAAEALLPLLQALALGPLGVAELLELTATVGWAEAGSAGADAPSAQAATLLRRTLATGTAELVAAQQTGGLQRELLARLHVWPTRTGERRPAREVLRARELEAWLPRELAQLADLLPSAQLLEPEAEVDAARLADAGLLAFALPAEVLVAALRPLLRVGGPVAELPAVLAHPRLLAELLLRLPATLPSGLVASTLPLGVDAAGRLVTPPLLSASNAAHRLIEDLCSSGGAGLPHAALRRLRETLAHPEWADQVRGTRTEEGGAKADPDATEAQDAPRHLLRPLPPVRVLELLTQGAEQPDGLVAWASSPVARARCNDWLLAEAGPLEADAAARALLGRLPLFPTGGGRLRPARDLLLGPAVAGLDGLGELGELGWELAPEVPEPLARWLARIFRLDQTRLRPLVDALLEALGPTLANGQLDRAVLLLRTLRRALLAGEPTEGPSEGEEAPDGPPATDRLPELTRQAQRQHLPRRLRVLTATRELVRPRELLLPDAGTRDLLPWLDPQPTTLAPELEDPEVIELLRAAGARSQPDPEELRRWLDGEGLGLDPGPRRALAVYLIRRGGGGSGEEPGEPALRGLLGLDRRAWVPDGLGRLHRPAELFWPDPELEELLGHVPELLPDPELVAHAGSEAAERFGFRRSEALDLETVLARLRPGEPARPPLLEWLEAGLLAGRWRSGEFREQLGPRLWLPDDRGLPRRPEELIRGGQHDLADPERVAAVLGRRRGSWPDAARYSKLAAVLKIPPRPGPAEVLAVGAEILSDLEQHGSESLLAREPELRTCLPRGLELLVEAGAPPPARFPLLVQGPGGELELYAAPAHGLCLAEPPELAEAVVRHGLPLRLPVLTDDDPALRDWLQRLGLPDLLSCWRLRALRAGEPWAEGGPDRERLQRGLALLGRLAPGLRELPEAGSSWSWDPRCWPEEVILIEQLEGEGELAGCPVTVPLPCGLEERTHCVLATPAILFDPTPLAQLLLRERILGGPASTKLVAAVAELLQTGVAADWLTGTRPTTAAAERRTAGPGSPQAPLPHPARSPGPVPPPPADSVAEAPGFWSRLRRWLGRDEEPQNRPPTPQPTTRQPSRPPAHPERKPEQGHAPRPARGATPEPPHRAPSPWEPPRPGREPSPSGTGRGGAGLFRSGPSSGPREPGGEQGAMDDVAPDDSTWFRPRGAVEPQLRSATAWLADRDRPPVFGFAFSPARLPLPWLYAARTRGERFDRRSQRWLEGRSPAEWGQPVRAGTGELVLRGCLPAGEALIPVPCYASVRGVETAGEHRLVGLPDGRCLLVAPEPLDLVCRVTLHEPPAFDADGDESPPREAEPLLEPTVPDRELPEELLTALAALGGDSPLERAFGLRDLVRRRYRYDPSYLEQPELAQWLAELARGQANAHLAMLHAGRAGQVLGRGVCYELNVLLCELLRRSRIPAAVATGWVMDGGRLADPDHLWALALLPTPTGPRWLPLDASTTEQGRPLRVGRRPPGRWRAPSARGVERSSQPPAWTRRAAQQGSASVTQALAAGALPLEELERVARHLEQLVGRPPTRGRHLREQLREALADPVRVQAILDALLR